MENPYIKTFILTNILSKKLHPQHRPLNVRRKQLPTKFTTITRRPKDLSFMIIQFKTLSWTSLLNGVNGFSHLLWIPYDGPIIRIPCMKKKLTTIVRIPSSGFNNGVKSAEVTNSTKLIGHLPPNHRLTTRMIAYKISQDSLDLLHTVHPINFFLANHLYHMKSCWRMT